MAIIIDNSKPDQINRDSLIEATNCIANRALAAWLDYGILFVIGFVTALVVVTQYAFLFPIYIIFACLYFPVLEGIKGWTIGKLICCIRVIDIEGNPPGFSKAFVRTLLRVVEANPFLIGGFPAGIAIFVYRSHQRLGDKLANTYVVKSRSLVEIRNSKSVKENKSEDI